MTWRLNPNGIGSSEKMMGVPPRRSGFTLSPIGGIMGHVRSDTPAVQLEQEPATQDRP